MKEIHLIPTLAKGSYDRALKYIGIDRGALVLARLGILMEAAIGDFDSVHQEDLNVIKAHAKDLVVLKPMKDDTDSQHAILYAIEKGYDSLVLEDACGGRMDHTIANVRLAFQYPCLTLVDEKNWMKCFGVGTYTIKKTLPYLSLFTDTSTTLSLAGVRYPLQHRTIDHHDIYTISNEIMGEYATLTVHQGQVLVIQAKD